CLQGDVLMKKFALLAVVMLAGCCPTNNAPAPQPSPSGGDRHLKLLTAADIAAIKEHNASGYICTGVALDEKRLINEGLIVKEVEKDSTAEAAGLKAGDVIHAVNGTALKGWFWSEAHGKLFAGPAGSRMKLTIQRGADKSDLEVARDLDERI